MHQLSIDEAHAVFDLAGEPVGEGRTVRPHRLLRSGYISVLPPAAIAVLQGQHHLTTAVDLRSPREIRKLPQAMERIGGIAYHSVGVGDDASTPRPGSCDSLADLYRGLVDAHGHAIRSAIELVAGNPDGATLVHCRTGRDRTGLVVGIALRLAGAPDEHILAGHARVATAVSDYVALKRRKWVNENRDVRHFDSVNELADEALRAAFQHIDQRWGDTASYLNAHGASADLAASTLSKLSS